MNYIRILKNLSQKYQSILKENLVGIYVHGSIAMGCFNWDKSDIDFIVVVNDSLPYQVKRELMDVTIELNKQAPPKGIEMSIVLKAHCKNFKYPTPFELHFSNMHRDWYRKNPEEYCQHMRGEDKDFAAHFTIIKHTGIVLYGEPIAQVFGEVPRAVYLDSIKGDLENAKNDVLTNPIYIILNLCRSAAFIQDGVILSKEKGGLWGLKNLDKQYHSVIDAALNSYRGDEILHIGAEEAGLFCDYMLRLLF